MDALAARVVLRDRERPAVNGNSNVGHLLLLHVLARSCAVIHAGVSVRALCPEETLPNRMACAVLAAHMFFEGVGHIS